MLDIPAESSDSNSSLTFKAFTERIPPVGTKVRVYLTPKIEKKEGGETARPAESTT
jgi:hypothetical protein